MILPCKKDAYFSIYDGNEVVGFGEMHNVDGETYKSIAMKDWYIAEQTNVKPIRKSTFNRLVEKLFNDVDYKYYNGDYEIFPETYYRSIGEEY